jgi:hypothetical protein
VSEAEVGIAMITGSDVASKPTPLKISSMFSLAPPSRQPANHAKDIAQAPALLLSKMVAEDLPRICQQTISALS